ncbi:MAG TPA: hypothetical protein VFQ61_05540, partial [Polyangiaceae bacterium]|nr:hypothetical protein [Polyangiaceae bacterium]
ASDTTEILPLDSGFSSRLRTATDALSGRAAQLARQLRVLAAAGAPVRLGYVAEAPVWRASYRLVLDAERDAAMVQGWALIHNDTDEAWARVNIELVNGQPDSFLFPMAAPRYARRQMTTPEERLSTVPQLALKTPDAIWGDHAEEEDDGTGAGLADIESVGGVGYGAGAGGIATAHPMAARAVVSDSISIGDLASVAKAKPVQESLLFSYRLADPISLRAHGSALLPFFDQALDAKRLTRFEAGETQGRATIRLVNASRNTLPAGPLAVFESAGFSGETVLARLRPGGRVFLNYGLDLDTDFREQTRESTRETLQVAFHDMALDEHYVKTRQVTLSFENHSPARRTIAYGLRGTVRNAEISGADALDYDGDTGTALALFEVAPGARSERQLRVREALKDRFSLDELSEEALARMTKAIGLEVSARAALTAAAVVVKSLRAEREREQRLIQERSQLDEDLERHREHLKAAGSSDGSTNPLAKRIVELESHRARIRLELEELSRRTTALRRQVAAELQRLPKQEPK